MRLVVMPIRPGNRTDIDDLVEKIRRKADVDRSGPPLSGNTHRVTNIFG
jgi:hypothetical protein